jgi:spore maturation protein A
MLNYIWGFMIVIGIIFGALNGTLPDMADAMLNSGKEAVTLCITMLGVMSIWTRLMEIAQETGMIEGAAKKIEPFITFMFPDIPKEHKARGYISTNIIANMLGLG